MIWTAIKSIEKLRNISVVQIDIINFSTKKKKKKIDIIKALEHILPWKISVN